MIREELKKSNKMKSSQNPKALKVFPSLSGCVLNNTVNTKNSRREESWQKISELLENFIGARRSKHTIVAYKESIYIFGGDNGKNMLNDFIRFDVKDKSWGRAICTGILPASRYHHSAVVHNNSMFIFGGYTGDIHSNLNLLNKNDLFEYKFQNGSWNEWKFVNNESSRKPAPRSAHGCCVYDNKLWVYAGYDGNARLNDMWAISISGENRQWEEIKQKGDCPPTCCNFPLTVARGCMYVFSGQSGLQITNHLFQFNFADKTWLKISNEHILRGTSAAPCRRYGHIMVTHDRFLYVFGGAADTTLPNDLHCFDLDSKSWSIVQPTPESEVPSGRLFHSAAVIESESALYIFGGTIDNNVRSGEMYRFQFSSYPKSTLHDDFQKLLTNRQFCDVVFIVGVDEKKISAHISLIAARSQFLRQKILDARAARDQHFEKLFGTTQVPFAESPQLEVKLLSAEPKAFEMVLDYIYTDRIDFKEQTDPTGLDRTNLAVCRLMMDVYLLAIKFRIQRLEHLCVQYLEFKITKENVLDALHNSNKMDIGMIKDYCLNFIVKEDYFYDIVMSSGFAILEKQLLVEIIRKRLNPHASKASEAEMKYDKTIGTTLENDMAVFLKSGGKEFCDINLLLDGAVISAHKSVLAARCQYFQGMFRSFNPSDNTVNIQIGDVRPSIESFHALLKFIYYGHTNMSTEDSLYLFQAPSFYGFTNNRLQAFCKHNLEHNITFDNVLQILEAADKMHVSDIKDHALQIVVHNFNQVIKQPKMQNMSRELLLEILMAIADSVGVEGLNRALNQDMAAISIHSESL